MWDWSREGPVVSGRRVTWSQGHRFWVRKPSCSSVTTGHPVREESPPPVTLGFSVNQTQVASVKTSNPLLEAKEWRVVVSAGKGGQSA